MYICSVDTCSQGAQTRAQQSLTPLAPPSCVSYSFSMNLIKCHQAIPNCTVHGRLFPRNFPPHPSSREGTHGRSSHPRVSSSGLRDTFGKSMTYLHDTLMLCTHTHPRRILLSSSYVSVGISERQAGNAAGGPASKRSDWVQYAPIASSAPDWLIGPSRLGTIGALVLGTTPDRRSSWVFPCLLTWLPGCWGLAVWAEGLSWTPLVSERMFFRR
ncbi:hypothetical protein F4778DRAFT_425887 [Xylariomycetidae sp. FL2044]|nr:hypothetical protein F4778DRAFT_425887 [Xylariomycetidae sp. FL2044]